VSTEHIAEDLRPLAQPIDLLKLLPGNPRRGDVEAVMRSYDRFGQRKPIVARRDGTVIAGNHQLQAAQRLGWSHIAVVWTDDDDLTAKAFALADNRTADLGAYDDADLRALIESVAIDPELLAAASYSLDDPSELLTEVDSQAIDPEVIPQTVPAKTVAGDVWLLGPHRLMCGDSTSPSDLARLMGDSVAVLLHADPPYGMGKESEGVANDNLTGSRLDAFQMQWWRACRPHLSDNASAYIWGNAADLWRLWYVGGLADSEQLQLRNEIVWDKQNAPGMGDTVNFGYSTVTERALFFMLGDQWLGNVNAEDYWEGWEPLRSYLAGEAEAVGLTSAQCQRLTGVGMFSHWFSKSQWSIISEGHYRTLSEAFPGRFARPWAEVRSEYDRLRAGWRLELDERRSYFDGSHEILRDVLRFSRVHGDDRHDHATPKPVDMMALLIRTSAPEGELVLEPFGGTGSTLMGAHIAGRVSATMELLPHWCDVICARWQKATGIKPIAESTGNEHDFLADVE